MAYLESVNRIERLFLHFFDIHFLEMKNVSRNSSAAKECGLATRFAILAAEEVLVPASSYFESSVCRRILNEFLEIFDFGFVRLVGGGSSLEEFIESKLIQYPPGSSFHDGYIKARKSKHPMPPFKSRKRSATNDIRNEWYALPSSENLAKKLNPDSLLILPTDLEERWVRVPDRLESRAFIVPNVESLLFKVPGNPIARNRLHQIINEAYFRSYTEEFEAGIVENLIYLESPHAIPSFGQNISFKALREHARRKGLVEVLQSCSPVALIQHKQDERWIEVLNSAHSSPRPIYIGETASPHERVASVSQPRAGLQAEKELRIRKECRIGVVTALPKEFAPMTAMLEEPERIVARGDPNDYMVGKIPALDGSGSHTVVVTLLKKMGNNSAAAAAANLIRSFPNIEDVLMVGIAGGIPDLKDPQKHIRLGDVVVSQQRGVVQYDNVKLLSGILIIRDASPPPSALMQGQVNLLEAQRIAGDYPWEAHVQRGRDLEDARRPANKHDKIYLLEGDQSREVKHPKGGNRRKGQPKIHYGLIGSANILLKDSKRRDELYRQFGIRSVEMEGSGIADATWNNGRQYLLIRGIADYGDEQKNDIWQGYAALVAAAYARALIESISVYRYETLALA